MKLGEMKKNNPQSYFIVCEEWNYPTESGRQLCDDWDTLDEALDQCKELADKEESNFNKNCGDGLKAVKYIQPTGEVGYIITPKNGVDEWYYAVRVIEVERFN